MSISQFLDIGSDIVFAISLLGIGGVVLYYFNKLPDFMNRRNMVLFGLWVSILGIVFILYIFNIRPPIPYVKAVGATIIIMSFAVLPKSQQRLAQLESVEKLMDMAKEAKAAALLSERKAERLMELVKKNNLEYLE